MIAVRRAEKTSPAKGKKWEYAQFRGRLTTGSAHKLQKQSRRRTRSLFLVMATYRFIRDRDNGHRGAAYAAASHLTTLIKIKNLSFWWSVEHNGAHAIAQRERCGKIKQDFEFGLCISVYFFF